jgi:hypothetical protein
LRKRRRSFVVVVWIEGVFIVIVIKVDINEERQEDVVLPCCKLF